MATATRPFEAAHSVQPDRSTVCVTAAGVAVGSSSRRPGLRLAVLAAVLANTILVVSEAGRDHVAQSGIAGSPRGLVLVVDLGERQDEVILAASVAERDALAYAVEPAIGCSNLLSCSRACSNATGTRTP